MELTPPSPVPPSAPRPSPDDGHLKLLAIFYYVFAGLTLVFGSIPLIHLVIGLMMVSQTGGFVPDSAPQFQPQPTPDDVLFDREPGTEDPFPGPPDEFARNREAEMQKRVGTIFIVIGAVVPILAWAGAFLAAFTGLSLQKRKRHTFCMVVAGLSCLSIPLGTVLGVFTILVLQRPSVRAAFGKS